MRNCVWLTRRHLVSCGEKRVSCDDVVIISFERLNQLPTDAEGMDADRAGCTLIVHMMVS